MHEQYCRVITPEPAINEETEEVTFLLQQCLELRHACLLLPVSCLPKAARAAVLPRSSQITLSVQANR